ncbi:MAG TPA: hypothetical protein VFN10_10020 [Thermoanaerobaculia bacterium]|nr:hypothetical protein [Thermoanaerobaculia bacterium]
MTRRTFALFFAVFSTATLALGSWSCAVASPLDPYLRAVEAIRGRKFVTGVKNVTIDRSELTGRLRDEMAKGIPYSLDDWSTILRAMQLVDANMTDVVPRVLSLYESQVLAYYDPGTKTYYSIRQLPAMAEKLDDKEMLNETVAVHELTHALQDQHFGIGKKIDAMKNDTEASMAYHAVIEGEATLVMMAHMMSKMGVEFDEVANNDMLVDTLMSAANSEQMQLDPNAPPYFAEALKFPYLEGLKFCIAAYRRGGWAELDKVHANPPRTSRQIIHPDEYFSGSFKPETFAPKSASDKNAIAVEHMGEFHWSFLVGAANARGWVNDRVTFTRGDAGDVAVRAETKWESPACAKTFADAYRAFLAKRGIDAKIDQTGALVNASYVAHLGAATGAKKAA